uniref:Ig-like domain-containing protein n=1 Tax=Gouania willdenowi TaxID=441366 RepID=A0A8C5DXQ6_GOUWI
MKRFGPAHFECRLTPIGDPTMTVEWLHDGKPLAAANRLRMINEFGYCSLDYEVAYARDSGVITCRATNKFGVDQTSATLIVKDEKGLVEETQLPEGRVHRIDELERMAHEGGPYGVTAEEETEKQKPLIVLLPEPTRVLEGDIARFRCRVTGYPAPKVNWYLNGQLIRKSKRYRLRYDGIYYMEITEIKSYDAGEVKVVADNNLGSTEHISLMWWTLVLGSSAASQEKVYARPPPAIPPSALGDHHVFGCSDLQVSWFCNNRELKQSGVFQTSRSGETFQLDISSVLPAHSGEYSCEASNAVGMASSSASLHIDGRKVATLCSS